MRTPCTMLNAAVFAPMPSARVRMARPVNDGVFRSVRSAIRRSLSRVSKAEAPLRIEGETIGLRRYKARRAAVSAICVESVGNQVTSAAPISQHADDAKHPSPHHPPAHRVERLHD